MQLIKHFNFTQMKSLDKNDWNIEVGEKWANNESQHYVDKPENLYFTKDGLVINATYKNGVYESARINTKHKVAFQYGKIDIIAKLPSGKGTWPALWMMSNDTRYGHWPRSGEIDIMEHVGNELDKLYLCIHTEAYNHTKEAQYYKTINVENITEDFHKYSLDWQEDSISYYLDDQLVHTYHKGEGNKDATHKGWPFDHPFYLIINLAIGGMLGGKIDDSMFPQKFIIKDIKIYQ